MKICIIGHPRTRSSLLLDTIATYYNIKIIGDDIDKLGNLAYAFSRYDGEERQISNLFKVILSSRVKEINDATNGVIRLHPTQLSYLLFSSKMIDLNTLNFNQYDKIYFTVRKDIPELVSSLFVAHKLKTFTYKNKQEVHTDITPMTLGAELYFQSIEMLLYSEFIMGTVKEYLTTNHIEWEQIDYDDVPKHIEDNYSGVISNHVETDYDYSNLVINYNQIQSLYEQLRPVVYTHFCKDNKVDK